MARRKDKEKAIKLRHKGYSYSQIKDELGISKSTLSGWLAPYPLSKERIRQLRDISPKRIESYRNTMARKRELRLDSVFEKVKKDIGKLSDRDLFLIGLVLYWGEGSKTERSTTALSNTDPAMLKFFLLWLKLLNVPKNKICFNLQIYSDMNKDKEVRYWLKELGLPKSSLRTVRIKNSKFSGITYKNGFGHGTCHIRIYNRDLKEYILMGLRCLKSIPERA